MKAEMRYPKHLGALVQGFAAAFVLLFAMRANASVSVLLEEPYGEMGMMNPTGHSAIYLDHVCADSPTVLRTCRDGELGVVLSRYDGIKHYDWLAIPLIPYLYAVDRAADIPETVDKADVVKLRDAYRRTHLEAVAPDLPDGRKPGGNWYELIGSAYDRNIYGFRVNSTPEQDASLIAQFNDRKNIELYNGAFRNCADFSRVTINRFYPHAIRRNFVADFGLTTPKSVARSLTHYAKKHPEAGLTYFRVPQVKGDIPRSHHTRGVAESLLKDYGVPLAIISPVTASVVLAAYIQHGRFSVPKDAPMLDLSSPGSETLVLASNTGAAQPAVAADVAAMGQGNADSTPLNSAAAAQTGDAGADGAETPAVTGGGAAFRSMNISPIISPIVSTRSHAW